MKKKKISLMLSLFAAATCIDSAIIINQPKEMAAVQAAEEESGEAEVVKTGTYNDITYSLSNNVITITGYNGLNPDLDIPSEITVDNVSHKVTAIGDSALASHNSLERVRIPETVTSIGKNAFNNCFNIFSLSMPDSVKTIGEGAFQNCRKLPSIKIPNGLKTVETNTFNGCSVLNNVRLPETITEIKSSAFANCTGLTNFKVPSNTINIGESVFKGDTALTNIDIADSVKSIGTHAFEGCTALASVKLPRNLEYVSDYTFNGCTALTSVETSPNIFKIGHYAFNNCSSLNNLEFPENLRSIGNYSFNNCIKLREVNLSDNVISLGNYSFYNCNSLQNVYMKDSVNTIGTYAFAQCTGMKNLRLSNNILRIEPYSFHDCKSLVSLILPNKVQSVGNRAFQGCTGVQYFEIPSTLTRTEDWCFDYMKPARTILKNRTNFNFSMQGLSYSYRVNLISTTYNEIQLIYGGNKVFLNHHDCYYNIYSGANLVDKNATGLNGTYTLVRKTVSVDDYTIESRIDAESGAVKLFLKPTEEGTAISLDDVTYTNEIDITDNPCVNRVIYIKDKKGEIAKGTVQNKSSLYVSGDLDTISDSVELKLSKIAALDSKVTVSKDGGESEEISGDTYTVSSNGEYKFTITTLDGNSYSKIVNVNNIAKSQEFNYSINNDNTVTITKYTGNDSYVIVPEKVTIDNKEYIVSSIGMNAFKGCTNLKKITLPTGLKKIENYAFKGCISLAEVYGLDHVTEIGNYAFNGCALLKNINIKNGTVKIGNYAYAGCDDIKEVKIPQTVVSIGNGAFLSCSDLKTLILLNSNVRIGSMAFRNCYSLTNIILRDFESEELLKNKGINLDDYYRVVLKCDGYTEIQLVRKGGFKLIVEDDLSYYNLYDGENLVTDLTINGDKTYTIVKKTAENTDYIINGEKGELDWYRSDVTIKASDAESLVSFDGVNFANTVTVKETLTSDKFLYIKNKDGIISKAVISKDLIKIDKSAPRIDVTGDLETKADKVDFTVYTDDSDSKVFKVTVSRDGGEEEEVKEGKFTANCKGKYKFTVTNGSGIETVKYVIVNNIDLAINTLDYDYELNDEDGTAKVTGYKGSESIIQIPSSFIKDGKKYKVTAIDSAAFTDNSIVKKVIIPDTITEIGDSVFYNCTSLESVVIPEGTTVLAENMFSDCTSLKEVVLPSTLTSIGESDFSGCTSLEKIVIPATVTSIGDNAFTDCTNLNTIVIYGENTDILASADINLEEYDVNNGTDENNNKIITLTKKNADSNNNESSDENTPVENENADENGDGEKTEGEIA